MTARKPRLHERIRDRAAELRRRGLTLDAIGAELECSAPVVCMALKGSGIPAPPRDRSKAGRRGVGIYVGQRPLPPWPTSAPPGSPERVAVLAERAEGGYALWHPDDAVH